MPPTPRSSPALDRLTDPVVRLYADAEQVLLQRISRSLSKGLASPEWAEAKLLELQMVQARLRGEMAHLADQSASEVTKALTAGYNIGQGTALQQLRTAGLGFAFKQGAVSGINQLNSILGEAVSSVLGQHQRILRSVDDIYRQAIAAATPLQLAGVITRQEAVQRVLNTFADKGITGFVDRAGRSWNLTSYTDMATRAAARRAQVAGHVTQLQAHNQSLVVVSDHAGECERCRPFEGKIFYTAGSSWDPGSRTEDGYLPASFEEAKAQGLFHPGCRHTVGLFIAETYKSPQPGKTADPKGYEARQTQRGIERDIRKWKNREAVAMDPTTRAKARAKVREHQLKMREHLKANPSLNRRSDRESLAWAKSQAKKPLAFSPAQRARAPLAAPTPAAPRNP